MTSVGTLHSYQGSELQLKIGTSIKVRSSSS
jgi:hypothetical protein